MIEFKLDQSGMEAIQQITPHRRLTYLVSINFSRAINLVDDWLLKFSFQIGFTYF